MKNNSLLAESARMSLLVPQGMNMFYRNMDLIAFAPA